MKKAPVLRRRGSLDIIYRILETKGLIKWNIYGTDS